MNSDAQARLTPETIAHQGQYPLRAQVLPGLGANLVSFQVDGTELLHCVPETLNKPEPFTGAFKMFPTPCRLAGASYEFEGKTIAQKKHGKTRMIHGLVYDEAMQFENTGREIRAWLDVVPGHPVYEGFPFKCTFVVTHALHDSGLTVRFEVHNHDDCNLPFGFGIHPYWRIQGERKDVLVRVPCDHILDLENLVPTGGVTPVEGTELDLRKPKSIDSFYIDNAFWKRNPGDSAELELHAIGKTIVYEASDNFPHMIVYAPEGESFLCVENLTTCPNAPNLVSAGHGDVANMRIVPPGGREEGWIKYTVKECG